MALPLQKTDILPLSLIQTQWKAQLDPVLANPMTNMLILRDVVLVSGMNTINHKLGRMQQGWVLLDVQGPVNNLYRSAPFNNLTLTLTSTAGVTVSIGVF